MEKYLVGSNLLGLSNSKSDIDLLVVVDTNEDDYYKRKFVDGQDCIFRSKANINRQMNFVLPIDRDTARKYIINYQLDRDIIGQDFPLEFHILDHRQNYVDLLKYLVDNKWLNFNRTVKYANGCLQKNMYHVAYLLFIIKNSTTMLTDEQRQIVKKIHDREMPDSYADDLAAMIKELKSAD